MVWAVFVFIFILGSIKTVTNHQWSGTVFYMNLCFLKRLCFPNIFCIKKRVRKKTKSKDRCDCISIKAMIVANHRVSIFFSFYIQLIWPAFFCMPCIKRKNATSHVFRWMVSGLLTWYICWRTHRHNLFIAMLWVRSKHLHCAISECYIWWFGVVGGFKNRTFTKVLWKIHAMLT